MMLIIDIIEGYINIYVFSKKKRGEKYALYYYESILFDIDRELNIKQNDISGKIYNIIKKIEIKVSISINKVDVFYNIAKNRSKNINLSFDINKICKKKLNNLFLNHCSTIINKTQNIIPIHNNLYSINYIDNLYQISGSIEYLNKEHIRNILNIFINARLNISSMRLQILSNNSNQINSIDILMSDSFMTIKINDERNVYIKSFNIFEKDKIYEYLSPLKRYIDLSEKEMILFYVDFHNIEYANKYQDIDLDTINKISSLIDKYIADYLEEFLDIFNHYIGDIGLNIYNFSINVYGPLLRFPNSANMINELFKLNVVKEYRGVEFRGTLLSVPSHISEKIA